jgi:iduronate 2-sulfatase
MDIYPTLRVVRPHTSPGAGARASYLSSTIRGSNGNVRRLQHMRGNHSLRTERWRYIRYRDGLEELYDHSNDELEWTNLAGNRTTRR